MTTTELAILSLISEKPRHGYELEQVIEQRGMREWTEIGFSSIYYILKKLEDKQMITSRVQSKSSGPPRKVFKITEEGQRTLYEGALEAMHTPGHSPRPFLLGLSVLHLYEREVVMEKAKGYLGKLLEQRDNLVATLDAQRPTFGFVEMMFDYSLTMIDAEIGWITEFITKFDESFQSFIKEFGSTNDLGEHND
jgi:DNA-binding PadR family transcriptional regulator